MLAALLIIAVTRTVSSEILSADDQAVERNLAQVTFEVEHLKFLLNKECPQMVAFFPHIFRQVSTKRSIRARIELEIKRNSYNQLMEAMIECQKSKAANISKPMKLSTPISTATTTTISTNKSKPTSPTSQTTSTTTQTSTLTTTRLQSTTEQNTTPTTTDATDVCSVQNSYTFLYINLGRFFNSVDKEANGLRCDARGACDHMFETCVEPAHQLTSDCRYLTLMTDVIGAGSPLTFPENITNALTGETIFNPIAVYVGSSAWHGVKIKITVWDLDFQSKERVDDFTLTYLDLPGSNPRKFDLLGKRRRDKTRLTLEVDARCEPSTTTVPSNTTTSQPTTTTTLPTTTTQSTTTITLSPAAQSVCNLALNLTESWRLDHTGSNIKGNGTKRACDLSHFLRKRNPWFRFLGAAGSRLLNKCPLKYSCGSSGAIWSNKQPVDGVVGIAERFPAYVSWWHCDEFEVNMVQMNCGNGDVIYRFLGKNSWCDSAFCGMNI